MWEQAEHLHCMFGADAIGIAEHEQRRRFDRLHVFRLPVLELQHPCHTLVMKRGQLFRMRRHLAIGLLQLFGHIFKSERCMNSQTSG